MKISFIGAGRVATHLAKALASEHQIMQICSRNLAHAQTLAEQVGAKAIDQIQDLHDACELVVIAVSDQAIAAVASAVRQHLPNVLMVHTSGSTDMSIIGDQHQRIGVFYPLQTFSLEREIDWQQTPVFIEANHQEDTLLLQTLAHQLSNRVYAYSSKQRLSLHLAAVFACNFANYCYDAAKQITDAQEVDFSLLYPLMLETAAKATQNPPRQVQTGPASRGDEAILQLHETLLAQGEQASLLPMYRLISEHISRAR